MTMNLILVQAEKLKKSILQQYSNQDNFPSYSQYI